MTYFEPGTHADSYIPLVYGNQVTLKPLECPGWQFSHWEYDGGFGMETSPGNGAAPDENHLTFYMNSWQGSGIRLKEGETEMKVRAVFEGECIAQCGGETSEWAKPMQFNHIVGYAGDEFDHKVVDPEISVGNAVKEYLQ